MPSLQLDTTKASIARVYDAFLGGKDNFVADREVYEQIVQIAPEAPALALAGRHCLGRAITFLASENIDQFLDLGCGLPTADNTHEVAQRVNRDAVTVYVDNDPTVAGFGRALLETDRHTHFCVHDLCRPKGVLADPVVTRALDFTRPLVLLQAGTLHHLEDAEDPAGIMRAYIDALPPGSYVLLSHWCDPGEADPAASELARTIESRFRNSSMGTGRFRTLDEIRALLDGLALLPASPNPDAASIVPVQDWWPTGPRLRTTQPIERVFVAALAYKPGAPPFP